MSQRQIDFWKEFHRIGTVTVGGGTGYLLNSYTIRLSAYIIIVDTAAAESLEAAESALASRNPYQQMVFDRISDRRELLRPNHIIILEYVCMVIGPGEVVCYASMSCYMFFHVKITKLEVWKCSTENGYAVSIKLQKPYSFCQKMYHAS